MKALISPNEKPIYYVIGWDESGEPIMEPLPDSCRVAEVKDSEFPVAAPLFWVDCPDNCVQDFWYYNTASKQCIPVPAPPSQG